MDVVVYKSDDRMVLFIEKWENRQFEEAMPIDIPEHLITKFFATKQAAKNAEKEIVDYCKGKDYDV